MRRASAALAMGGALIALAAAQCITPSGLPLNFGIYHNTTDPANDGAVYIGAAACRSCHADYAAAHRLHAHANTMTSPAGAPPIFPSQSPRAGVPEPPAGFAWTDIAYVVGGYTRGARFVGRDGFVLTDGIAGVNTQWNLDYPPNATAAGFVPFRPDAAEPLPFEYDVFSHIATGARPQDPAAPLFQDGRAGILGTWAEPGVQCEACHGPGSRHVSNPFARNLFVDLTGESTCFACHSQPLGSTTGEIAAADGFVHHLVQYPELRASGGHRDFSCTYCHDTHYSSLFEPDRGIRNKCTACHTDLDLGFHEGEIFTRGDYSEPLSCESCHMPFAARDFSSADSSVVGPVARVGDTRSHIFRINTTPVDFTAFFTEDGTQVRRDADGRAAVTVDFVCLRCHNGNGAFPLTVSRAAEIASQIHTEFE